MLNLADIDKTKEAIINSTNLETPAVRALIAGIDLDKRETLIDYGQKTALSISESSGRILNEMEKNELESAAPMMNALTNLVKKFDPADFKELAEKKGLFGRVKETIEQQLQKLLDKYTSFGGELSKIVQSIEQFKIQRNQSNALLRDLYNENWRYYQQLQEHIFAGEIWLKEINDNIKLQEHRQRRDLFERQIQNLKISGAVALGTMPAIQMIIGNNIALLQKYDAMFITTIPAFKNGIIQFLSMKQQAHEAQAMNKLGEATNELLLRNTNMAAQQMKEIAVLTERPGVSPESIISAWETIKQGIEESEQIRTEAMTALERTCAEIRERFS
jgi:uncharacterized protein YaaN involved in tellurite resistance